MPFKHWNDGSTLEDSDKVEAFLQDIQAVYDKHGMFLCKEEHVGSNLDIHKAGHRVYEAQEVINSVYVTTDRDGKYCRYYYEAE